MKSSVNNYNILSVRDVYLQIPQLCLELEIIWKMSWVTAYVSKCCVLFWSLLNELNVFFDLYAWSVPLILPLIVLKHLFIDSNNQQISRYWFVLKEADCEDVKYTTVLITPYKVNGSRRKVSTPNRVTDWTEAGSGTECDGRASCLQAPNAIAHQLAWISSIQSLLCHSNS